MATAEITIQTVGGLPVQAVVTGPAREQAAALKILARLLPFLEELRTEAQEERDGQASHSA